ncbi:MAG: hypothetical protein ACRC3Y_14660 [Romboutsia sp.]|uniref:hypothetical protein n=1 Tax=Romboutsia sp. TaxID=1965302 RepID=UPI003F3F56C5
MEFRELRKLVKNICAEGLNITDTKKIFASYNVLDLVTVENDGYIRCKSNNRYLSTIRG